MILDALRQKSEALHQFIIEHDSLLALIRRLPREILAKIFILCMPNYGMSSFDPERSPLLVGRVCVGWRQVALSTEALWSSITVTRDRPSEKMANLWISRALSVPLTIHLDCTGSSKFGPMQSAISVLVQYCDRWKILKLRIPESTIPRLQSIRHRLPSLESLSIQNPKESRFWSHEFSIFEFAPRLSKLSLGPGIFHARLKIPWHQLTELTAHIKNITECLEILQLVPNLVKCIVYNVSSTSEASIPLQNTPTLTFPRLRSFSVLHSVSPDEIFKHLQLPIIHALHVAYNDERKSSKDLRWFSQQPFLSLLSSSHTLRKLEIDCLRVHEDSVHVVCCLRAAPSLEELCLRGSGGWITADLLRLLTRQENIDALVPALEVVEIRDHSIPSYDCMSMIESRQVTVGAYLKRVHIEGLVSQRRDFESLAQMQTGRNGHLDCKHPEASGLARRPT
jgi:F-box-like